MTTISSTIRVTDIVDLSPDARKALQAYKAVQGPALQAYEAIEGPALQAYKAVQGDAIKALSDANPMLGEAARNYSRDLVEVVAMLPCSLGALEAHADDRNWCETWKRLRYDAISKGVLVAIESPMAVTE